MIKRKKDKRFEFVLEERDYLILQVLAIKCRMSVSRYVRMLIDSAILDTKIKIQNGDETYENLKTFLDDKLQQREVLKSKVGRVRK